MEAIPSRRSHLVLKSALLFFTLLAVLGMGLAALTYRPAPAFSGAAQVTLRAVTEKTTGPAAIEVTIHAADGSPLDDAQVTLRGDMTHAGMKPVIVQMREIGRGTYLADNFNFTMAGDWILTVEAILPGGEKTERTFDLPGVTRG